MAVTYTSGAWRAKPGEAHAFIEAWRSFAEWASTHPGAGALTLVRDVDDSDRFLSFAPWESIDAAHAWKGSPDFRERMGAVQRHVAEFTPHEYELVTAVEGAHATLGAEGS